MSNSKPSYQLRPNKSVERHIFIDAIDFARMWNGPSHYIYAAMGGQFLEDFRLVNDRLPITKMISFEIDETVSERQEFNKPLSFIDCHNINSRDFVDQVDEIIDANGDTQMIVWLDYTVANERRSQLQELFDLLAKLRPGDIVKITMNANPNSVKDKSKFGSMKDFRKLVRLALEEEMGDAFFPENVHDNDMSPEPFSRVIANAIRRAATQSTSGAPGINAVPLTCFRYNDYAHQMVSTTIVLADAPIQASIDSDGVFQQWPFKCHGWGDIKLIDVPDVSAKERAAIHEGLFRESEWDVHENLPFKFDADKNKSFRIFQGYVKYYKRYPSFARVLG
jgi:hypothetical protein